VPSNLAAAIAPGSTRVLRSPWKIQALGVVITARNQTDTVAQCIDSIFAANSYAGWRNSLWIVVVADACTDSTAKVARDTLGAFGQVLEITAGSIKAGHRIGERAALEHFQHVPRHTLLIASVEASRHVSLDWLDVLAKHTFIRI
jgi:hypothetical protein